MNNQQISNYVQQAIQNSNLMSNKNFNNAVGMYRNGQSQNLRQFAENACREFGMTYDDAKRKLLGM